MARTNLLIKNGDRFFTTQNSDGNVFLYERNAPDKLAWIGNAQGQSAHLTLIEAGGKPAGDVKIDLSGIADTKIVPQFVNTSSTPVTMVGGSFKADRGSFNLEVAPEALFNFKAGEMKLPDYSKHPVSIAPMPHYDEDPGSVYSDYQVKFANLSVTAGSKAQIHFAAPAGEKHYSLNGEAIEPLGVAQRRYESGARAALGISKEGDLSPTTPTIKESDDSRVALNGEARKSLKDFIALADTVTPSRTLSRLDGIKPLQKQAKAMLDEGSFRPRDYDNMVRGIDTISRDFRNNFTGGRGEGAGEEQIRLLEKVKNDLTGSYNENFLRDAPRTSSVDIPKSVQEAALAAMDLGEIAVSQNDGKNSTSLPHALSSKHTNRV